MAVAVSYTSSVPNAYVVSIQNMFVGCRNEKMNE